MAIDRSVLDPVIWTKIMKDTIVRRILLAAALFGRLQAEPPRAELYGRTLDPAGAPIDGARVMAIPEGRSSGPAAISDRNGLFFLSLEAGGYTLIISKEGFLEASRAVVLSQRRLDL